MSKLFNPLSPLKKQKVSKSRLIKKLDMLFSKKIRERDGACLRCGKSGNLQCAHLISRTYKHLRWNERNCITLCYACHIHWSHRNPLEFSEWLQKVLPENYNYVLQERYKDAQPLSVQDIQELYSTLLDRKLEPLDSKYII